MTKDDFKKGIRMLRAVYRSSHPNFFGGCSRENLIEQYVGWYEVLKHLSVEVWFGTIKEWISNSNKPPGSPTDLRDWAKRRMQRNPGTALPEVTRKAEPMPDWMRKKWMRRNAT